MSAVTRTRQRAMLDADRETPHAHDDGARQRGFALGFLTMIPLFAIYEIAVAPASPRNTAEVMLFLPLASSGADVATLRPLALCALAGVAAWRAFDAELGLLPRAWRVLVESALAAVVLGPALLALSAVLGIEPPRAALERHAAGIATDFVQVGIACGGAAYEELVFRVGVHGALFVVLKSFLALVHARGDWARALADACAIVLSGLGFAAAHLAAVTEVLGFGGEEFDPRVFTWRALAGMLFCALYRWRGPGVAAWTHALFNWALLIGAGPHVFV